MSVTNTGLSLMPHPVLLPNKFLPSVGKLKGMSPYIRDYFLNFHLVT